MQTVYLDHAATTPVDPRVMDVMLPFFKIEYGNTSSIHQLGRKAKVAVENCREKTAGIIGANPSEIIFTSGGTESNNAAIFGALANLPGRHIVAAPTEHASVLRPIEQMQKSGYKVTYAELDEQGRVLPEALEKAITEETVLVSLMHTNNETGTIHLIPELTGLCRERGILFHSDAVQSVGKVPIDVVEMGVDSLSMSAHKFNGPKGTGALYVRGGADWSAWMHGGLQEHGRRGGTLNVPGIVGLAKALELSHDEMPENRDHIRTLRQRLINGLLERFGDTVRFNGDLDGGMPHLLSVTVTDRRKQPLDGEMLLLNLDMEGICCSGGSACTSGALAPSHVMLALGYDEEMAKSTLRFSLGKSNTEEEVDKTVGILFEIVSRHSA